MSEEYNGWKGKGTRASAYATWRVALEMFDGSESPTDWFDEKPDVDALAEWCETLVDEYVADHISEDGGMLEGWINAFLNDVSWEEIAETMLADWPEEDEEE